MENKDENKENDRDVFKEAQDDAQTRRAAELVAKSMEFLTGTEPIVASVEVIEQDKVERIPPSIQAKRDALNEGRKALDTLEADVTGFHCDRFNNILAGMPDKEFVRIFPKVLEFFVPKAQHKGGGGGVVNNVQININRGNGSSENENYEMEQQ